jgi:hypothetical protein
LLKVIAIVKLVVVEAVQKKDLDTDGALSSQNRWPAWIVDHCTAGPNCPEATKAALTNPDGRQC